MGGLEHVGEARWGGGPARWPQAHLGSHGGPREYDGGEEIGLQPLGYGLDCKRGRSVVPQKGISPPPITADPGGGGWEACNRAAVLTVTAGVGRAVRTELVVLAPPSQAEPVRGSGGASETQQDQ